MLQSNTNFTVVFLLGGICLDDKIDNLHGSHLSIWNVANSSLRMSGFYQAYLYLQTVSLHVCFVSCNLPFSPCRILARICLHIDIPYDIKVPEGTSVRKDESSASLHF